MKLSKSKRLYEEAKKYLPGGCSSAARVGSWYDPHPVYIERGKGSRFWDADGNEYIDYLAGFGALILGHCHPKIMNAIRNQTNAGAMFGTPTELELKVAKKFCSLVPCADMVAFCNSGTEATMNAIRIARAYTGRTKIIKFEGHYHGHHDYVLFSVVTFPPLSGSQWSPYKLPYWPGIPEEVSRTVLVAPWNDLESLERILKKNASDVAAIIMEPIMANNGVIMPKDGYLKGVKELAEKYDVLLIFDEVFTGFRISLGGAQEYYNVKPDLATFAKALGGGAPIAAVAGVKEVMSEVGPGKIPFVGTYNASPIALAASSATLEQLSFNDGAALKNMRSTGKKLMNGLKEILESKGHEACVQGPGVMFQIFFTKLEEISNYREFLPTTVDFTKFKRFRDAMLHKGVLFHPDPGERIMLSAVHTSRDVNRTLQIAEEVLRELPKETVTILL